MPPIRADVQRELVAVRAEQQSRTQASQAQQPCRPRDVSELTVSELERTRRELAANLALVRPSSPARADPGAHQCHRHRTSWANRLRLAASSPGAEVRPGMGSLAVRVNPGELAPGSV